ncbi:hematopoietic prostaglandin D synthase-like isoform X1 [Macrobrachium nipponense]|uniref:hematopoietic prostaglandin D synthase-like isoform X1 n=1 Tax=Macrobrachium nipponense TaxID=159736 RepID=UPI0030C801D1
MPEYTLMYFNAQGRGELIRWLFAHAGIEYNDDRIEMEDWPERKPDVPGGKLPVLMIDGKPLVQSVAIARYVAKEAGLVPEDNLDAAYCDALVDTCSEMMHQYMTLMFRVEDDDEKQRLFEEEFFPNHMEPFMKRLNHRLEEKEWFITDDMTWADLAIGRSLSQILAQFPDSLEHFPNVAGLVEKVCELPAIKEWIDNRPETSF